MLIWSEMKSRNAIIASAVAIVMLAAGCASGPSASVGAAPRLRLEKTSIVVAAFPAIDSAGLYIAQMDGLFAAQGLKVKIVSAPNTATSTQDLINGQISDLTRVSVLVGESKWAQSVDAVRIKAGLIRKAAALTPDTDELSYVVCARDAVEHPDTQTRAVTAADIFTA